MAQGPVSVPVVEDHETLTIQCIIFLTLPLLNWLWSDSCHVLLLSVTSLIGSGEAQHAWKGHHQEQCSFVLSRTYMSNSRTPEDFSMARDEGREAGHVFFNTDSFCTVSSAPPLPVILTLSMVWAALERSGNLTQTWNDFAPPLWNDWYNDS